MTDGFEDREDDEEEKQEGCGATPARRHIGNMVMLS
jgi:hypothetical protein